VLGGEHRSRAALHSTSAAASGGRGSWCNNGRGCRCEQRIVREKMAPAGTSKFAFAVAVETGNRSFGFAEKQRRQETVSGTDFRISSKAASGVRRGIACPSPLASEAGAKGCEEYRSPNACPSRRRRLRTKLNLLRRCSSSCRSSHTQQPQARQCPASHRVSVRKQSCTTRSSSLPSRSFAWIAKVFTRVADNVKRAQFPLPAAASISRASNPGLSQFSRPKACRTCRVSSRLRRGHIRSRCRQQTHIGSPREFA